MPFVAHLLDHVRRGETFVEPAGYTSEQSDSDSDEDGIDDDAGDATTGSGMRGRAAIAAGSCR